MRIVFMGTPDFAVPSLEILAQNGYEIVAVITAPDKPAGRGLKMQPSAVKTAAERLNLPVWQPEKLKNEDFLTRLRALRADLQIVVAFRMLPEAVWAMPPLGTFNLHASLLPQYRGAAPINWAIVNGETETGVTTFFLRHEIDTGDIIMQAKEPIYRNDTAGTLYERLMHKGAQLVLQTVQAIEKGEVNPIPQPQLATEELKTAPKIFKETCRINFYQTAENIFNFVRGMNPLPTAWTIRNEKTYKIYKVQPFTDSMPYQPGEWYTDGKNFLHIGTIDGYVAVEELQLEGKKRMRIAEFLRGNRV
ncbi:MAG: methionyl-tRNA formyltransferase [Cytophagales bacterium]|nr:methionyl-tRNA formyltransferase [Bernardetiaceae bacterium]MDW8205708.1 methionyl-tRNA formyltransferase [Cytophagales bacterium]